VTILKQIIPLEQLTKLIIVCDGFTVQKVIKILFYAPNVHTLELQSILCYQKSNCYASIKKSKSFQQVCNTNIITNVTCDAECTLQQIKLLVALCPQIQHLTINALLDGIESIVRFLLDKTDHNTRHLCSLCFSKVYDISLEKVDMLIKSEALLDDYTLKIIDRKLCLWW
jgi:hypothetical protein